MTGGPLSGRCILEFQRREETQVFNFDTEVSGLWKEALVVYPQNFCFLVCISVAVQGAGAMPEVWVLCRTDLDFGETQKLGEGEGNMWGS